MATDTPPPRPAATVTVSADQLIVEAMSALTARLGHINVHPDGRLYCRDCRGLWTWPTGPITRVIDAALAHECPPARPVSLVSTDRT